MKATPYYYLVAPLAYSGNGVGTFTYHSDNALTPGQLVEVSLGRRNSLAVVLGVEAKPKFTTKAVVRILPFEPIPNQYLELARWMQDYYDASPSSIWTTFLPAGIEKHRRVTKPRQALVLPSPTTDPLTPDQSSVIEAIMASPLTTHLLHGITGSGKTRVYIELAKRAIMINRSVIILVPEITLAPQLVALFEAVFGDIVITTHSKMTESDRHKAWTEASESKQARIVVGPRSSLFLPVPHLGLIIVDECHETTYKQEQNPRYQATLVAGKLASLTSGRLILGSATPGLTELHLSKVGRIGYHRLTRRATGGSLPESVIIDLRDKLQLSRSQFLSNRLLDALGETFEQGRQSLLYINRRGSASSQLCGACGYVSSCPNCQLPLTFHADLLKLICHHCNWRVAPPATCTQCGATELRYIGSGTKRIESELTKLFPTARIARLDRDSADLAHLEAVYRGLHDGTIDMLVGTQMIAKGLDLPGLDTVGVVSADTLLHLPDFRAGERTFDLITQVSGRAGRRDRPGRVFVQTFTPDHPVIVAARDHNFDDFAATELRHREALVYPPYTYLVKLVTSAVTAELASERCTELAEKLHLQAGLTILGPAPCFREKVGKTFRWQLLVKSRERNRLTSLARLLPNNLWTVDLDPADTL